MEIPFSMVLKENDNRIVMMERCMSSVLGRIQNFRMSLTPSEKKVADFLVHQPTEAIECAIGEVAKRSEVSMSSVSRLATTLGYRDWKELRLNLAKESAGAANPVFSDVSSDDSDASVVQKIFAANTASLQETLRQIRMEDIDKAVKTIKKTDRIVFFGTGGSGCYARDEAIRFAHLDLAADAYTETFPMMLQAARLTKGQVAFGFSNAGRSRSTVAAMAEAKRNGALTIGISNCRHIPLEKESTIFFCTSFPQQGGITAALTPRIALSCIMDCIYVLSAHHGRIAAKVEYLDQLIESAGRIPLGTRGNGSS